MTLIINIIIHTFPYCSCRVVASEAVTDCSNLMLCSQSFVCISHYAFSGILFVTFIIHPSHTPLEIIPLFYLFDIYVLF